MDTKILEAALRGDGELQDALHRLIHVELGMKVSEFASTSGIPAPTLYKILSGQREPSLETLRRIWSTARNLTEHPAGGKLIAVIAARGTLESIEDMTMVTDGEEITIREYPALSMEEAIITALKAERDGACALVCAPIVATTVERIVSIPVSTIRPGSESLSEAIRRASKKSPRRTSSSH